MILCILQYPFLYSAAGTISRFLANHLGYEALTLTERHRERRNVELFFKWIKQQLQKDTHL